MKNRKSKLSRGALIKELIQVNEELRRMCEAYDALIESYKEACSIRDELISLLEARVAELERECSNAEKTMS